MELTHKEAHMNKEPSWLHMLWIIPSVIVTETLMVLGIMRRK